VSLPITEGRRFLKGEIDIFRHNNLSDAGFEPATSAV
jgi:hypothetical protein